MTNEEIRKRFEFDLKMGRFKVSPDSVHLGLLTSKNQDACNRLFKLLTDIGKTQIGPGFEEEFDGVYIFSSFKNRFQLLKYNEKILAEGKAIFNEIPDYIKEYKINDE